MKLHDYVEGEGFWIFARSTAAFEALPWAFHWAGTKYEKSGYDSAYQRAHYWAESAEVVAGE